MAKKKGKSGAKPASGTDNASSPNTLGPEVENSPAPTAEASEAPSPEPSTVDAAPSVDVQQERAVLSPVKVSSSSSEIDDLKKELEACKAQIAELQTKNAALTEENQRLKSSQTAVSNGQPTIVAAVPDFEALTQRIATLKAEQAEADAAREAAWSQLKSVVADIARLAAPDAVIKAAGTPTASATAGFGAA